MNKLSRLCFFLFLIAAGSASADGSWQLEARSLPVPVGASPQIQAAIADAGKPNTQSRSIVPSSAQQWRELIAHRGNSQAFSLEDLGKQLNVAISRDTLAGVAVHRIMPKNLKPQHAGNLFVYLHGGAYVFGGGDASVREGALIASVSGMPVVSIDYRMPPDHPQPAAVEDVTAVYKELLKIHKPAHLAMGGTSAGGGLTLASVHSFKSLSLPVPGALYLGTPWADLTDASDSLHTNEGVDRFLVTYYGMLSAAAKLYANGEALTHPLISPVYGDFTDFPPTYLVSGTRDMLLSDTVRVHRKLRIAGVTADLNVYEGLSHAEYAFVPGAPEWRQVYGELARFLDLYLAGQP